MSYYRAKECSWNGGGAHLQSSSAYEVNKMIIAGHETLATMKGVEIRKAGNKSADLREGKGLSVA